jgi:hypothetical protein
MSNRTLEAPEAIEFDVDRSIGTHAGRDDVDSRHRQQSEQHGGQQSGFHGVGFTEWFEERGEKRGRAERYEARDRRHERVEERVGDCEEK